MPTPQQDEFHHRMWNDNLKRFDICHGMYLRDCMRLEDELDLKSAEAAVDHSNAARAHYYNTWARRAAA